MKVIYLLASLIFIVSACGSKNNAQLDFKVLGNCSMCEKNIETALKDQPGIQSADWNVDTKMLSVKYDSTKTNAGDIYKKVAATGYDSEKSKGSDEAYAKLHECCQYKRSIEY